MEFFELNQSLVVHQCTKINGDNHNIAVVGGNVTEI